MDYKEFYNHLYTWMMGQKAFQVYSDLKMWYTEISIGNQIDNPAIEYYDGVRVPPEEATFLRVIENIDTLYYELRPFLIQYLDDRSPCEADLLRFQEYVFRSIYREDTINSQEEFRYDFVSFFDRIAVGEEAVLEEKPIMIDLDKVNELLLYPKRVYVSES